ncbi:MAG: proton-conducting transporter membrane subunit [Acidocella sp.]|nr:proton-conducting transporter membrane subunit [Acidocella sp.]
MEPYFTVMFGLPGQGLHWHIDALSALFLCILAPQIIASAIADMRASPAFWVFAGGMVVALAAADGFTLIFGFELMSAASWLLVLRGDQRPATLYIGTAMASAACLIPAVFLPASSLAFMLVLLGAGAKAGLAPLHVWLPRAHTAPPAGASAVMSGGMVKIALYVVIRYGFIVFGAAAQPWWGVVLIIAGIASVLIGSLRAMLEIDLKTVLACSTVEHVGLIAVGLGVGLRAKAMGDPALAALALQGALLCAVAHGLFKPLLFLGVGAVKNATGTNSLNWLGGLMRGMPRLGGLMIMGAMGMAALPLGPGFAPEFLLLHAVIAAAATGGILARIGFIALVASLGVGAALALAAAVRIIGIGFLGRPRSLHAAAAADADVPTQISMGLLALLIILVSLLPGLVVGAMVPVIRLLIPDADPLPLAYAPLSLAVLLILAAGGAWAMLRWLGARGTREAAPWNGGFGPPPVWLPFGEPTTQLSATGFAEPVMRAISGGVLAGKAAAGLADPGETYVLLPLARLNIRITRAAEIIRRSTIRQRLVFVFAALVVFLLTLGVSEGG